MHSLERGNLQAPKSKCVWSVTRPLISPQRKQMGCPPSPWLQESIPIRPCFSTNPRSAPVPCRHSSRLVPPENPGKLGNGNLPDDWVIPRIKHMRLVRL